MESLLELFCEVDDFCKKFQPTLNQKLIAAGAKKRNKPSRFALSEIMTILIYFQQSHYRDFKQYYLVEILQHRSEEFP